MPNINNKGFMDKTEFLYLLKQELVNTNLVFQSVDSSILNFSTNLPMYLNKPSDLDLIREKASLSDRALTRII